MQHHAREGDLIALHEAYIQAIDMMHVNHMALTRYVYRAARSAESKANSD